MTTAVSYVTRLAGNHAGEPYCVSLDIPGADPRLAVPRAIYLAYTRDRKLHYAGKVDRRNRGTRRTAYPRAHPLKPTKARRLAVALGGADLRHDDRRRAPPARAGGDPHLPAARQRPARDRGVERCRGRACGLRASAPLRACRARQFTECA